MLGMNTRPIHHCDRCPACNGTGRDRRKRKRLCSVCWGAMWMVCEYMGMGSR